jgi:hypothetical protein
MATAPKPFYYQLDGTVIGPVTGIDLRDAALAGNVAPTTLIANDPDGEWIAAIRIRGLFNESGKPLPHPLETQQHLASASSPQTSGTLEASARSECEPEQSRGRAEWYVQISDRQIGPLTDEQLAHMAANGRLREDDMVRLGKDGRWTKASETRGVGFSSGPPISPSIQTATQRPQDSHHEEFSARKPETSLPSRQHISSGKPLSATVAWVLWPIAFFLFFASFLVMGIAESFGSIPVFLLGALGLSAYMILAAIYVSWLILDVSVLQATQRQNSVDQPTRLNFSPVWCLPFVNSCLCGPLLFPLSMIHLLHDRKRVLEHLAGEANVRPIRWATIKDACSHRDSIVALVLTWVLTLIVLLVQLFQIAATVFAAEST